MKPKRICTRYNDGICRLHGYDCNATREVGDSKAVMYAKEVSCYWFTRDIVEGQRVIGLIGAKK